MISKRVKEMSAAIFEKAVAPIMADGPTTHAALSALQVPNDCKRIAFFHTGLWALPPCKTEEAQQLKKMLRTFRHDSALLRYKKTSTLLHEAGAVKKKEALQLLGDFQAEINNFKASSTSNKLRLLQPLEKHLAESILFVRSRPAKVSSRQYGEMISTILDTAAGITMQLEFGKDWQKKSVKNHREKAETFRQILTAKGRLADNLDSLLDIPSSEERDRDFHDGKAQLYESWDSPNVKREPTMLSPLVRNLRRHYFAHRQACLEILSNAVKEFTSNPDTKSLQELRGRIANLVKNSTPPQTIARNPFTVNHGSFRELLRDLNLFLGSKHIQDNPDSPLAAKVASAFNDTIALSLRWEAWSTPAVQLFSEQQTLSVAERFEKNRFTLKYWRAAAECLELGSLLHFRLCRVV